LPLRIVCSRVVDERALKIGAKPEAPTKRPLMAPGAKFVAANDYGGSTKHVACVDELHPTDQVYLLIGLEIREKTEHSETSPPTTARLRL
jgi:hypothetical protein